MLNRDDFLCLIYNNFYLVELSHSMVCQLSIAETLIPSVGNNNKFTLPKATCVQDLRPTWESWNIPVVFSESCCRCQTI